MIYFINKIMFLYQRHLFFNLKWKVFNLKFIVSSNEFFSFHIFLFFLNYFKNHDYYLISLNFHLVQQHFTYFCFIFLIYL